MRTVRTDEERLRQYQQLTDLMLEDKDCRNDVWRCIKKFFKTYHNCTIDDAIEMPITSISTLERDWRKLRENNPKLKDLELSQVEYKQTALDSVVVEKDGKVRLL
jgi:hypothetical protein